MKKTLGGDRLGSGKKMKVEMRNFERATFDMSYVWRSTMSAGTLVPFLCEIAMPGDTFDINLDAFANTHPTLGPLFGSGKVQLDIFQAPIRLYNGLMHNNALNIGLDISQVKFPQLLVDIEPINTLPEDVDNAQINPSCILSYLGLRGFGLPSVAATRNFNAIPLLAYWDIYKNYYAVKPEEIGAMIHTTVTEIEKNIASITIDADKEVSEYPAETLRTLTVGSEIIVQGNGNTGANWQFVLFDTIERGLLSIYELVGGTINFSGGLTYTQSGTFQAGYFGTLTVRSWRYAENVPINSEPQVVTFDLSQVDKMREEILMNLSRTAPFVIDEDWGLPYSAALQAGAGVRTSLFSQEGLGLKAYQSDLFNNWLSTEWIDGTEGISAVTAISTVGDSFTIDTLNLSRKVYNMLNRIAVAGGSLDDWQDAVYNHSRYYRAETPMYMGGLIQELIFQEVISNSAQEGQPLGTLAGKGRLSENKKGGKIVVKVDEPSYIIGIVSITPRLDYSQGNKWDVNLKTLDDVHKPDLDQIGFQDLVTEQMAWWTTLNAAGNWIQTSAGKQPAWINYMTNVNVTRGNFAIPNNEMFMTYNRRYEIDFDRTIKDLTAYIDPSKFNFIFAETSLDSQNYWMQIGVNMIARRKMSAKIMPNM